MKKASEAFEGPNSSMKKTFDEATLVLCTKCNTMKHCTDGVCNRCREVIPHPLHSCMTGFIGKHTNSQDSIPSTGEANQSVKEARKQEIRIAIKEIQSVTDLNQLPDIIARMEIDLEALNKERD